jgi:hypothetical protein
MLKRGTRLRIVNRYFIRVSQNIKLPKLTSGLPAFVVLMLRGNDNYSEPVISRDPEPAHHVLMISLRVRCKWVTIAVHKLVLEKQMLAVVSPGLRCL